MSAKKKSPRRRMPPREKINDFCIFCKEKTKPDYKDYKRLFKFLSDRAKIIGRKRTGLCAKHQRRLGIEVKRARHLGLLPFTEGL